MLMFHPSGHNHLITMLTLCSPLLDPQYEIPERIELTILDHVSPRHLSEVKVFQPVDRLDYGYCEGESTSPYRTKFNNPSHNTPTMKKTNH
jgi:hypothetical protein